MEVAFFESVDFYGSQNVMNKQIKNHNKSILINLTQIKCVIGSNVLHRVYGICRVVAAEGAMRTISAPARGEVRIRMATWHVHLNELKELTGHASFIH